MGHAVYGVDGQCVFANEALATLVGATLSQLLSQNYKRLASWAGTGMAAAADDCFETGEDQARQITVTTTFGKPIIAIYDFRRVELDGERFVIATLRDVEARYLAELALRRSEERLRSIFDRGFEAKVIFDEQGIVHDVNKVACDMFGISRDDFLNVRVGEGLPPEIKAMVDQSIARIVENGVDFLGEIPVPRADGGLLAVEGGGVLIETPEGRLISTSFREVGQPRQPWNSEKTL